MEVKPRFLHEILGITHLQLLDLVFQTVKLPSISIDILGMVYQIEKIDILGLSRICGNQLLQAIYLVSQFDILCFALMYLVYRSLC